MRILLLTHSFNSLTQRLFVELRERGHEVSVEFDIKGSVAEEALALARPDLIIAPFLKRAIPESLWRSHVCLVVHPGPAGDRGPSALDWAILEGRPDWGITVLQAEAEMDAGPVWEEVRFPMRAASKSSLYRNEVTEAAVDAVLRCVTRFPEAKASRPPSCPMKPAVRPADRRIDWSRDGTADVLRKIRSADGVPGLLDSLFGRACTFHDAHEAALSGSPGTVVARSGEALGIATRDGGFANCGVPLVDPWQGV
ncbi:MAG: hypothetical protein K2Q10_00270 [Rhodospirillales bacterium]|nr:hypothetical protein [Rhodospirillales bacterium]